GIDQLELHCIAERARQAIAYVAHRRCCQAAVEQRVLQSLDMLRAAALGELKQRKSAEDRLEMQTNDVAVAFERRLAVAALRSWAKRCIPAIEERLDRCVSADQVDAGVLQAVQLLERPSSLRTRLDNLRPAL